MSSDITFITNESGKTLRDRFAALLGTDTRQFDCLVGYFFISGFYKIYPSLEKVERVRILAATAVCDTPSASIGPAAVLQAANDILAFLRQERQFEQKLITLKPPPPTESDYPFLSDGPGSVMGSEQDEISVQIALQFTDDFWENCKLTARAAEEWRIPRRGCINRLLRLRPASDQDTSLEDAPELLDQVEKLSEVVADNAFARSKL